MAAMGSPLSAEGTPTREESGQAPVIVDSPWPINAGRAAAGAAGGGEGSPPGGAKMTPESKHSVYDVSISPPAPSDLEAKNPAPISPKYDLMMSPGSDADAAARPGWNYSTNIGVTALDRSCREKREGIAGFALKRSRADTALARPRPQRRCHRRGNAPSAATDTTTVATAYKLARRVKEITDACQSNNGRVTVDRHEAILQNTPKVWLAGYLMLTVDSIEYQLMYILLSLVDDNLFKQIYNRKYTVYIYLQTIIYVIEINKE